MRIRWSYVRCSDRMDLCKACILVAFCDGIPQPSAPRYLSQKASGLLAMELLSAAEVSEL